MPSASSSEEPPLEQVRDILLEPDALVERLSPIIAEVLSEQIAHARDDIAQALAPVMGEALRRQVYQSRQDIVDALYPVIGQAIRKAVTEAMYELAQAVDARVRASLRPQEVVRRWLAQLRGIPPGELTLRTALPFAVREVFLIHRESGLLIYHASTDTARRPEEREVISGMLTAIRDFARDAFGRGIEGELGTIEYGTQRILLEAGGTAYLAVVVDGVEPAGFRETLRQILVAIQNEQYARLKQFDGTDPRLVRSIERKLEPLRTPPRASARQPLTRTQRVALGTLLATMVLLPVVLCGGWVWHVENALSALRITPTALPSPTVTGTPTPTLTLTPTATVTPSPSATPTPAPVPGVMLGNAYVREAPGGDTIGRPVVLQGTRVEVLTQFGEWYKVRVPLGNTLAVGWVPAQWVLLSRPLPAARVTPTLSP